jgi:hypothetical protein
MKLPKLIWTILGTVVLIAVIAEFAQPKMAHTLVATFGQVAHTLASPVLAVNAAGPTTFVASQTCLWGDAPDNSPDDCDIEPLYTVPPNQVAVIDSVSGVCVLAPTYTIREFQLQYTGPDGNPAQMSFPGSPAVQNATNFFGVSITALNVTSYASGSASGTPINFKALANHAQPTLSGGYFCRLTVSGHYSISNSQNNQ